MRIVGGKFRGRRLASPSSDHIRPTTDRTRESLFNILQHKIDFNEKRVIDLFAGTGALGLEAISRGASYCLFVEQGTEGRGLIRTNVEALGLQGVTRIFKRDACDLGPIGAAAPFDLVFMDPPYAKGLGERAIASLVSGGWITRDALVVLEEAKAFMPDAIAGFEVLDQRIFGETALSFLQLATDE